MSVGPRTGLIKWSLVVALGVAGAIVGVDRWAVRWDVAIVLVAAIVGWLPGVVVLAATAIPHSLIHQDGVHSLNEFLLLAGISLAAATVLRRPVGADVMPRRAALRFILLATIALSGAAWTLAIGDTDWTRGNLGDEFLHVAIGLVLGAFVVWLPWRGWRFASVLWGPALALTVGFGVLLGTVGFWEQGDEELLQLTADSTASGFLNTLTDELNVLTAKAATSATVDFTATTFPDLLQTIVFGDDLITSATLLQFDRPAGTLATVSLSDLGPDFEQSTEEWVRSKNVNELTSATLLDQNVFLGLVWLPLPAGNQQPHLMYLSPLRTDGELSTDRPRAMVTSISIPSLVAKALAPALGSLNDVLVTVFEVGIDTFTPIWTSSSSATAQGDYTALPAVDPVVKTGKSAASESSVDLTVLRFVAQRGENFGTPLTTRRLTIGLEALLTLVLFGTLLQTSHDRVRRENERRRREILLSTALEGAPGWTAIVDEDDCVLVGNADQGGTGVGERIHDATIWRNDTLGTERVVDAVHRARSGSSETLTLSPKHEHDPDHPIRIFEILARRIESVGSDTLVFLQCVDVTERRELAMRTAQSERMESLGVLAGSLAHDFNNLLFITQGYLQMMERQPAVANDPQLLRFVSKATDAVHRGATIAKSLLAVARSQPMTSVPLSMEQFLVDLDPLLTQALSDTPSVALHKEVVGNDLDVMVDPGRLSSAVLNLVFNARDAMEAGGTITIRIERTMATDSAGDVREVIAVQVRDTGKGMSPEVAARAYEPFFTTGKVGKGTGLGLAAVYSFAQQSGGWTTIDSREGSGTTVSIFLRPAIVGHTTAVPLDHPNDQRLRALVVDDEESLAELVAGWLGELGLETRVATNSATAQSVAREFEPHLLLSDSNLGEDTDGATLAQKLTENLPTLVTVFMTGFSDRLRALETVGAMTLAKPFSRDDLRAALMQVLGSRFTTSTEPTGTKS